MESTCKPLQKLSDGVQRLIAAPASPVRANSFDQSKCDPSCFKSSVSTPALLLLPEPKCMVQKQADFWVTASESS